MRFSELSSYGLVCNKLSATPVPLQCNHRLGVRLAVLWAETNQALSDSSVHLGYLKTSKLADLWLCCSSLLFKSLLFCLTYAMLCKLASDMEKEYLYKLCLWELQMVLDWWRYWWGDFSSTCAVLQEKMALHLRDILLFWGKCKSMQKNLLRWLTLVSGNFTLIDLPWIFMH